MSTAADLNTFLASVEKRAFNLARLAVQDQEEALDIVQDSMMALATKYANRPGAEWQPLFFRILNNRINDHHRRTSLKRRFFSWLPQSPDSENEESVLEHAAGDGRENPERRMETDADIEQVSLAVQQLPARQQQAFMWCTLEGMSIAEAASCMGCSEGSVKTHHHRALTSLRASLEDSGS